MSNVGYNTTLRRLDSTEEGILQTNSDRSYEKIDRFFELDTARVTDIIIEGADSLIGRIEYKTTHTQLTGSAFPLNPNIRHYPVIGEWIVVGNYGTENVYYTTLNRDNNINANMHPNTKNPLGGASIPLYPNQGDTILQSRFGSGIRMSNTNYDDTFFSPIVRITNKIISNREDINIDGSSIVLSSGDNIIEMSMFEELTLNPYPYSRAYDRPTTFRNRINESPLNETEEEREFGFYEFSLPSNLNGEQLILSSDRIVLSSKINEMLFLSNSNVGFFTRGKFSVDSRQGISFASPRSSFNILSDQIYLGSPNVLLGYSQYSGFDRDQPVLLGMNTVEFLTQFLGATVQFLEMLQASFKAANDAGQLKQPALWRGVENYKRFIVEYLLDGDGGDLYEEEGKPLNNTNTGFLSERWMKELLSNKVFVTDNISKYTIDD